MQSIFEDQAQFMQAGGQTLGLPNDQQLLLYGKLIEEEFVEFDEEMDKERFKAANGCEIEVTPELLKEAFDIIVVAAGFLVTALGPEKARRVWTLGHASNLLKVTNGGEKRADGKILKNSEWKAAVKNQLMAALQDLIDG